jgi:hypothetical protein
MLADRLRKKLQDGRSRGGKHAEIGALERAVKTFGAPAVLTYYNKLMDRATFPEPHNECQFSSFCGGTPKGYKQLKITGPYWTPGAAGDQEEPEPICVLVHHILHFVNTGVYAWGSDLEISHLCHTRDCVNREHVVLEHHHLNSARFQCPMAWMYPHFVAPHARPWVCPHEPPCILPPPRTDL